MRTVVLCIALTTMGGAFARTASAADRRELIAARDHYADADYDGALTILNGLTREGASPEDVVSIEQYRALCFMALGNAEEADAALEAIVAAIPSYHADGQDISPRLSSLFVHVRRRVLPGIVQREYATAKAAYERHDYEASIVRFQAVLLLLDDPEFAAARDRSFADLRVVAIEFRDLAVQRLTSGPAPPRSASPGVTAVGSGAPRQEIYSADNAEALAPIVISQTLPPYRLDRTPSGRINSPVAPLRGIVEVTIGENGEVIDARMSVPTKTMYDLDAVAAARRWQYHPATVNGTPVKYLKVVYIKLATAR